MNKLTPIELLLNEMKEDIYSNDVANGYIRIKVGKKLFESLELNDWLCYESNHQCPTLLGITIRVDDYLSPYEIQIDNVRTGYYVKKDLHNINYTPPRMIALENKKIKKQLEEYKLQNVSLRADVMIKKMALPNELIKDKTFYDLYDMPTYEELLAQQKEFIDYLGNEININPYDISDYDYEDIINTILSKYKEIIGDIDDKR